MKIKFPYRRFSVWLYGFTNIIDGLCLIFTLGFWYPDWGLKVLVWGLDKEQDFWCN